MRWHTRRDAATGTVFANSWGLNSSALRAASRATASNKRGARCDAVAKAQAVLARFWAMKRSTRPSALAAMASNNSGAASAAVAYAQACALSMNNTNK